MNPQNAVTYWNAAWFLGTGLVIVTVGAALWLWDLYENYDALLWRVKKDDRAWRAIASGEPGTILLALLKTKEVWKIYFENDQFVILDANGVCTRSVDPAAAVLEISAVIEARKLARQLVASSSGAG